MPTERFLRLPYEKRKMIHDAVVEEFSRVPFEKASINRMVTTARISRGSFYTYFEDKEDALECIVRDFYYQGRSFIYSTLEANGGSYFDAWEQFLDTCLTAFSDKKVIQLAQNTFNGFLNLHKNFDLNNITDSLLYQEVYGVMEKVDLESLNIKSIKEFMILNSLLLMNLSTALALFYHGDYDVSQLRGIYRSGIRIIKHGALCA